MRVLALMRIIILVAGGRVLMVCVMRVVMIAVTVMTVMKIRRAAPFGLRVARLMLMARAVNT